MKTITRKKNTGETGNGGEFGTHNRSSDEVTLTEPFRFDRDYQNHEQVRPYFDDYLAVRAELDAAGQYNYNDLFKGRIPGVEGPDEDTAIYMLQNLYRLDETHAQVDEFKANGGREVDDLEPGEMLRGTVLNHSFYVGGTGTQKWEGARLGRSKNGQFFVLPKGARTRGHTLGGGGVLFHE